jgi:hypothetical protein
MSTRSISWAFDQSLSTNQKFVLVTLAAFCDEKGLCDLDMTQLHELTGLNCVKECLEKLTVQHIQKTDNGYVLPEEVWEITPVKKPKPESRFRPPTLEEVLFVSEKAGLPVEQAKKFFNFYESKGWMIGKNKMKSVPHALANWRLTWQERNKGSHKQTAWEIKTKLDVIDAKLKSMRAPYSEIELTERHTLKTRRDALQKEMLEL